MQSYQNLESLYISFDFYYITLQNHGTSHCRSKKKNEFIYK